MNFSAMFVYCLLDFETLHCNTNSNNFFVYFSLNCASCNFDMYIYSFLIRNFMSVVSRFQQGSTQISFIQTVHFTLYKGFEMK